jgi:riboflavin synthase
MFTGIIEHSGTIESLSIHDDGGRVTIHAPNVAPSLAVSNSIAVNGCCLTVVTLDNERFSADLSGETVRKTSFGTGSQGHRSVASTEQPLTAGKSSAGTSFRRPFTKGRSGHAFAARREKVVRGAMAEEFTGYILQRIVIIDCIILTFAQWRDHIAEIAVIPYTYEHTNIRGREPGDAVNLEGDILGKYIERHLEAREAASESRSGLTFARLREEGF